MKFIGGLSIVANTTPFSVFVRIAGDLELTLASSTRALRPHSHRLLEGRGQGHDCRLHL